MSNFGDSELSNIRQSLEQIEDYLGSISKTMEKMLKLQAKQAGLELIQGNWERIR